MKSEEVLKNIREKFKDDIIDIFAKTPKRVYIEIKPSALTKIANYIFDDLEDGARYIIKLDNAPDSSWIESDKEDVQEDINQILDDMINSIIGDDLLLYRKKIAKFQESISDNKVDIVSYREKKINAPVEGMIQTTKSDYDKKIQEKKDENKKFESAIEENRVMIRWA